MKRQPKQQPAKVVMPAIARGQEKAVLAKLIAAAKDYDAAWQFIHKAFPRKTYGRVRDVVQKFSTHKTLRAAFNAAHAKQSKRPSAEQKRAA